MPRHGHADDLEEFRACQAGLRRIALEWNDMCRGATQWCTAPDDAAREIGLNPKLSGVKTEDEGLYTVQHGYWMQTMQRAIAVEEARQAAGIEHVVCAHTAACDHA